MGRCILAGHPPAGGARIASGSYTGTGTYGESNPTRLHFGFAPKLVVLLTQSGFAMVEWSGIALSQCFIWIKGVKSTTVYDYNNGSGSGPGPISFAESGEGLSWFSGSTAYRQCNSKGMVYYYVAIG